MLRRRRVSGTHRAPACAGAKTPIYRRPRSRRHERDQLGHRTAVGTVERRGRERSQDAAGAGAAKTAAPAPRNSFGRRSGAKCWPPRRRLRQPRRSPPHCARHQAGVRAGPTDPAARRTEIPAFIAVVQAAVPDAVTQISFYVGDWPVIVPAAKLLEVGRFLARRPKRDSTSAPTHRQRLADACAAVRRHYTVCSQRGSQARALKVRAAESEPCHPVTGIWPAGELARARGVRPSG